LLFPTDKVAALGWIRKAAEQGETLGQFTLGIALRDGHGQKPDRAEAIRWLGLAAAKGQTEAEFALAMLLLESATGTEAAKGAGWLRQAAEQGFAPAQFQLGEILLSGVGVKPDAQEAYQWLLIATANPQGLSREQRNATTSRLNAVAGRLTAAQRVAAQQAATLFSPAAPSR
jgi:TPR repeat protein